MILDGLQVTLLITLFAALLGTLLGGVVCWAGKNPDGHGPRVYFGFLFYH